MGESALDSYSQRQYQEMLPAARPQERQHLYVEVGEKWPSDRNGSVKLFSRPDVRGQ